MEPPGTPLNPPLGKSGENFLFISSMRQTTIWHARQYRNERSGEPAGLEEELVVAEQQSALPGVTNGDSYLHIDDDAPCLAGKDSYDNDDTVEEIASKRKRVEQSPSAEDDEKDGEPMATTQ